jgi:hypothetical protein
LILPSVLVEIKAAEPRTLEYIVNSYNYGLMTDYTIQQLVAEVNRFLLENYPEYESGNYTVNRHETHDDRFPKHITYDIKFYDIYQEELKFAHITLEN